LKQKTIQTTTELSENAAAMITVGDNSAFTNLAARLAEIRKQTGVAGYILRNDSSAIIDVPQQEKLTDYALLSWQIAASSSEIAKQFQLTTPESMVVEGKTAKVLCLNIGENKISLFMDKTTTHAEMLLSLTYPPLI
jgi:predicted regulator of Ras-like GTPase activity (Roadblock/LC7/MglB family)